MNIHLGAYTLDGFGNLARLRNELLAASVKIRIERARHITAYMKAPEGT